MDWFIPGRAVVFRRIRKTWMIRDGLEVYLAELEYGLTRELLESWACFCCVRESICLETKKWGGFEDSAQHEGSGNPKSLLRQHSVSVDKGPSWVCLSVKLSCLEGQPVKHKNWLEAGTTAGSTEDQQKDGQAFGGQRGCRRISGTSCPKHTWKEVSSNMS